MRRRESVPVCAFIIFVLCWGMIPSPGFAFEELEIYGFAESFTWREFEDSDQLLRESGPLFGIGVTFHSFEPQRLAVKVRGELFGRQVHYVGQACKIFPQKTCEPFTSNTNYFGLRAEGDVGPRFMVGGKTSLEPFAGAGLRWWVRYIEGGNSISGEEVSSATELWTSIYFRLGMRGDHEFSKSTRLFAEAGVFVPIYNTNYAEARDITLNPGIKPSLFSELGMTADKVKLSFFYEGLRFRKSDVEVAGQLFVWQPKSKADIYGIRVGYIF